MSEFSCNNKSSEIAVMPSVVVIIQELKSRKRTRYWENHYNLNL